jgi:acyl-CoA synthetase (AMP-forming)/AMP-acid ligase II
MQPLLDHPDFDPRAVKHLQSILVIGPRPMIEQVQRTFPNAEMIAACGMTEAAGIYALSDRLETVPERSEAQGKAAQGIELRVIDILSGEDVPDGTMGEILLRGYCVMTEYYKDPDKSAQALDDEGWLHTGDLYTRTPDGRVIFHGRLKDMLKVGGENVATIEIESFLCSHPAVRMASVIGRPDPRLDEVPVAFVELEDGEAVTGEELREFCKGQISSYKIPAEILFVLAGEWPMSTTKIDKRGLRARLGGAQPRELRSQGYRPRLPESRSRGAAGARHARAGAEPTGARPGRVRRLRQRDHPRPEQCPAPRRGGARSRRHACSAARSAGTGFRARNAHTHGGQPGPGRHRGSPRRRPALR